MSSIIFLWSITENNSSEKKKKITCLKRKRRRRSAEQYDKYDWTWRIKEREKCFILFGWRHGTAITLSPNFSQNDLIINVPTKVYKHGHQPIGYGLTSISRFFILAVKYKCDIRKKNGWTFSYPRLLHLNFHIQALKWNLKSFYSSAWVGFE